VTRPNLARAWTHPLLPRDEVLAELARYLDEGAYRQGIRDGFEGPRPPSRTPYGNLAGVSFLVARRALEDPTLLGTAVHLYPSLFGIPGNLAALANALFERMPDTFCGHFAVRFHEQVAAEAQLEQVPNLVTARLLKEVFVPQLEEMEAPDLAHVLTILSEGIASSWDFGKGRLERTPQKLTDQAVALARTPGRSVKGNVNDLRTSMLVLAYGIRRGLYTAEVSAFSAIADAALTLIGSQDKAPMLALRLGAIVCDECARAPAPHHSEAPTLTMHP
jgi:hypothetical protein